ncbi:Gfo/Idh/MocA family protein [Microcella sp.]|uniref:Gfo/Idh/MocA family protein n=1 Tax=Microcella sp. TaxID=1913979 RepID=UPI0025E93232|nr:Gfo/Idh/MocA family oxidoreductase [Microcella sp.]
MSSIAAALIGGGFMGEVHTRALRAAGVPIVGVASSSAASAERAAERLRLDRAYANVDELLADDAVTLVHVLTPNDTHAPLTTAALAAGKHVVCEKPLATSSDDARALVEQAASTDRITSVPFVYRFHPMVREARGRIARGETGRLLSVQGAYLQDWLLAADDDNWRVDAASGGASRAFADIGSHLCDLLEFIAGERIARLTSRTRTVHAERGGHPVSTEDLVGVLAELEGGAVVSLLVSQVAPGRKNGLVLELHGEAESLRFVQERPEELWIGRRRESLLQLRNPDELQGDAARLSVLPGGHPLGYQDAFTAFVTDTVRSIEQGTAVDGLPVFTDGLRAAQLTEAVLDSAARDSWVDLPALT